MSDSLPEFTVLTRLLDSNVYPPSNVLGVSKKTNTQQIRQESPRALAYRVIDLRCCAPSTKNHVSRYSDTEMSALASKAFKLIYGSYSEEIDGYAVLRKHQSYIIQLIASKDPASALRELQTLGSAINSIIDDSTINSCDSQSVGTGLLSSISFPSSLDMLPDAHLVSTVVSYYFLAMQSFLQYVTTNLKTVSQNKDPILNHAVFTKIALQFRPESVFNKWLHHSCLGNQDTHQKHFQNYQKIVMGFTKILHFVTSKINSLELRTAKSLFEIKLLEIQCINNTASSTNFLSTLEVNYLTTTFLNDLLTAISNQNPSPTLCKISDRLKSLTQERAVSSKEVPQNIIVDLVSKWVTFCETPSFPCLGKLSSALLASPSSASLLSDQYFLRSISKSTKALLSSHNDMIYPFLDAVMPFIRDECMCLDALSSEHLHFLDTLTIYTKNSTCSATNESLELTVKLLDEQFKIYSKFADLTRIRNLSCIFFNLGKQLQSLECWDKALLLSAFIYKNAPQSSEEDFSSLQNKVEKIVGVLYEAERYSDCHCILNSFLIIVEESRLVPSSPFVSSLAKIDMPLVIHMLAKCLVANRALSNGLVGDSSKFSNEMKCLLFIKLCQFLEKLSDHEQKVSIINSLARDLRVTDPKLVIISEYHYARSCGLQSKSLANDAMDKGSPLFEAGILLLRSIDYTTHTMSTLIKSFELFKDWISSSYSHERPLYSVYETEILKLLIGFLNFNAKFAESIELVELHISNKECKTANDSQVNLHLHMEACDAALQLGHSEKYQDHLKAAGILLKSLSSFTDSSKRLTKISAYDIAKWKLLQIQCSLGTKSMEQIHKLFASTLNFIKSKPEFDLKNNVSSVSIEARFNNLNILARLNLLSGKLHIRNRIYADAFSDFKKVLKILHSVLTKVPHNVPFLHRSLVKWNCISLLVQAYELILRILEHGGLTKDLSYYIRETRKLCGQASPPLQSALTSHYLARFNILMHNFKDAESDIRFAQEQGRCLPRPSGMTCVEEQSAIMYKEINCGLDPSEKSTDDSLYSLLSSVSTYRKLHDWNIMADKFPLLRFLHAVSLSGRTIDNLSEYNLSVDKNWECLAILLVVKNELLKYRMNLSSDPFTSVINEAPITFPCIISTTNTYYNTGGNTGSINELSSLKSMLFKCISSGYLESLSVHELHDFSVYLTECFCELSHLTAFKSTASESVTGILFYMQDLAKSLPFTNEMKIQELQHCSTESENDLLPINLPNLRSEYALESAAEQFTSDLIDTLPNEWSVITLDFCTISGDLMLSRFAPSISSSPFLVRLPLSRSFNRQKSDFQFTFEDLKRDFEELVKQSDSSTKRTTTSQIKSKEDRRKWWKLRFSLDMKLKSLLDIVEKRWIGGFKGIFSSAFKIDEDLFADFVDDFQRIWRDALKTKMRDLSSCVFSDLIVRLFYDLDPEVNHTLHDPEETELEDMLYFMLDVVSSQMRVNAIELVDIEGLELSLRELLRSYSAARKSMRSSASNDHIILIPSSKCHFFPWESLEILRNKSVSRMPSVKMLLDTLQMRSANDFSVLNNERNGLYYLINPGGDLVRTESRFGPVFQSLSGLQVSGHIGSKPRENDLISQLVTSDLFVFLGHGGCEQYIRTSSLFKARFTSGERNLPPSLLIGCSSGHLQSNGFLEACGNVYNWLLCGTPMMVVNLWDVTDKDIDLFSLSVFQKWGLIQGCSDRGNLNICEAVAASRDECTLKYLNGAAPIVYGLPLMLR